MHCKLCLKIYITHLRQKSARKNGLRETRKPFLYAAVAAQRV